MGLKDALQLLVFSPYWLFCDLSYFYFPCSLQALTENLLNSWPVWCSNKHKGVTPQSSSPVLDQQGKSRWNELWTLIKKSWQCLWVAHARSDSQRVFASAHCTLRRVQTPIQPHGGQQEDTGNAMQPVCLAVYVFKYYMQKGHRSCLQLISKTSIRIFSDTAFHVQNMHNRCLQRCYFVGNEAQSYNNQNVWILLGV